MIWRINLASKVAASLSTGTKRDRVSNRERGREEGQGEWQRGRGRERLAQVGGKLKRTGNGFTAFRWRIRDLTWQQQPQREGICCHRRRQQQQQCCYLGYAWVFYLTYAMSEMAAISCWVKVRQRETANAPQRERRENDESLLRAEPKKPFCC